MSSFSSTYVQRPVSLTSTKRNPHACSAYNILGLWLARCELPGDAQANDSATNDEKVALFVRA